MADPFKNRSSSLSGPATDMVPVTPSDAAPLADAAIALYIETAGVVAFTPVGNPVVVRTVSVGDQSYLPVGVAQVRATGTTATGLHALVLI